MRQSKEEMAEEIANKRCHEIMCYGHCSFNSPKHHRCGEWHREYNCALAGLKAGRPQWHDLRKNPTDIPPMKDDIYSVEVWAKNAKGDYGTAVFSYACLKDDGKYNHWIGIFPVLWTELPTFEE